MKRARITLTEFDEPKTLSVDEFKDWFPSGKFDKRAPWECVKKWININQKYLNFLGILYSWDNDKGLTLETSDKIGLAPIRNPYGGKVYGSIVVKPRIGWIKISEILDSIEWRIKPNFLETEEPIMSDGVLPSWLKAIDTLKAIERALQCFVRGMMEIYEIKDTPVGSVNWDDYSTRHIPYGKWNRFGCIINDFSLDIDIHRQFKGIIMQIEKDIDKKYVPINVKTKAFPLFKRIKTILEKVHLELPDVNKLKNSKVPPFYRAVYEDAIKRSIEYVSQSKFSIHSGDFFGLPWSLAMDRLFEYWVEFWSYKFAKQIGANFYSDIRNNSKIRFLPEGKWEGLREIKPDIIIDKDEHTIVIDTKYKKHLFYLRLGNFPKDILEEHRKDIHQILAYVGASSSIDKKAILIYPKLMNESIVEKAIVINYKNTNLNITLLKIDTSFDPVEFLEKLRSIWFTNAFNPIT